MNTGQNSGKAQRYSFCISVTQCLALRWARALVFMSCIGCFTPTANAFRYTDLRGFGFPDHGVVRWDAAPHLVDGVERSLDGGLRYSLEGGSYEAFRAKFQWASPAPTVAEFQQAVENVFRGWEAFDAESGLGTDLYFVPDFGTPISLVDPPDTLDGRFIVNPGAEIDFASAHFNGFIAESQLYADPNANSVTLTSGVEDYPATVISGADIRMNTTYRDGAPWELETFQSTLSFQIGAAIGLASVDPWEVDTVYTPFYDDNYDATSDATALATLTNSFANLIDPLDPDNSPALLQFEPCNSRRCDNTPGFDSPGVHIVMEHDENVSIMPQNDDLAGRQFLYPLVAPQAGDFDGDSDVDGKDFLNWQREPSLGNLSDWQANFGAASSLVPTQQVPEPSGSLLVIMFVIAVACYFSSANRTTR